MGSVLTERMRHFGGMIANLFNGNRDLYQVFGYSKALTSEMMVNKYARQDIAARIVEAEPNATWSDPPTIEGVDDAFALEWRKISKKHNLMDKFSRADKICGMSRYSVLMVGYNDSADPSQPVRKRAKNEILYIQPYSETNARVVEWENDPKNARFGQPKIYQISPAEASDTTVTGASINRRGSAQTMHNGFIVQPFKVHHSRILHISENVLEDSIYGYPRMMRVFNLLDDLLKTVGGASETFWLTSNRGMQVDVDKEMDFKEADADALSDELDEYMHNLTRIIRTKGVKINNLGSDVADPRGTFGVIVSLLSGATGIPQRILLGSEAGQLASEQDRANWATRIEERRDLFAEPVILARFVIMQIENHALPEVDDPELIEYDWPDAFKQNPLERAQTNAQQARSLANVSKALSDDRPAVTLEEGRKIIGIMDDVPAELVAKEKAADDALAVEREAAEKALRTPEVEAEEIETEVELDEDGNPVETPNTNEE